MSHGPSLGGEPAHGPAGRRTMQSAARTGYPRYVDLTYTPHFEGLEIVYGSRGRTGSSSSSRNPVRGVMRTWTLTGSSLYRTDPLPGYPGYPLHASPEIRGNYEFEEEIEGQEATRWNVLPCVRLKNGATPAMVPPPPVPAAAPTGKFDLITPPPADLEGVRLFLACPALPDEKALVINAANQLTVAQIEDPSIVPTKNRYAVMIREHLLQQQSVIAVSRYHGNLTTSLTHHALLTIITFDFESYSSILDEMIPDSPLTGLERIARGLRETAKVWRYYTEADNFLTGYLDEMHLRVQSLSEIITPAIEHVSVDKVKFFLKQDIISLRAALGRQADMAVLARRADLCTTVGSRRATLWAEHERTREESARLQAEHTRAQITEADIIKLIRANASGNKRLKTERRGNTRDKTDDEMRAERRSHWCTGSPPKSLPSLSTPAGVYTIVAAARGCGKWVGKQLDMTFLTTGQTSDPNKIQAILSNPPAGMIFQGGLYDRYRRVRHFLIANDNSLLDKFVTRVKLE